MLLAMATGTICASWVVTGASLSRGAGSLIIGIPFVILFIGATRMLALVEGRIVESCSASASPRSAAVFGQSLPVLQRIGAMLASTRAAQGTMLYFLMMLPSADLLHPVAVTPARGMARHQPGRSRGGSAIPSINVDLSWIDQRHRGRNR